MEGRSGEDQEGYVPETKETFDCTIYDVSDSGAKIEARNAVIPATFILVDIKNRIAYEVKKRRHEACRTGVEISRRISLLNTSDEEARQLRRLLVEQSGR